MQPDFADKTIWTEDNLDILRPQEYLVARLRETGVI